MNVPGNNGKFFPTDQDGNIIEGNYETPVGGFPFLHVDSFRGSS